ncbi:Uu.00g030740.m01.CDS01 [Anthostomella pinea]|uniref:Uu.00g030740.m01.CDS01 n=1 Tax=Anthostomella pinea TaxID=933095 RepID=A0AAI8YCX6_9PEZI|nr:Uu.00g030740.m01.CDS01 [Anthostomella pinea]
MLPDFLSNSYTRYKDDTRAFTTWLRSADEACGYKPAAKKPTPAEGTELRTPTAPDAPEPPISAPVSSQRLKGKARKLEKQAQVQVKPTLPETGNVKTVKYNVSTREVLAQAEAISQAKNNVRMPSSIKTNLERAIEARQRCAHWYEAAKLGKADFDQDGHRYFISLLQDVLAKLEWETTAKPASSTQATGNSAAKKPVSKSPAGLELPLRQDHPRGGNRNHTSSHQMIRRAEEDLCGTVLPKARMNDCYKDLTAMMVVAESITQGLDATRGVGVEVTPFDSFVYFTLMKFAQIAAMSNKPEIEWPPPIPTLQFN